ncbi:MAG TPA: hypothetical protein VGD67_24600, partial [Pseudonocardiaceae bacterium]
HGEPIAPPEPPAAPDLSAFPGRYAGPDGTRVVDVAEGVVRLDGVPLRPVGEDTFALPGDPYLVTIADGALTHGPGSWWRDGGRAPRPHPPRWSAYPGLYRAHNVFQPAFHVLLRDGELLFASPYGREVPLVPTEAPGVFRLGDRIETVAFDTEVDRRTLRAVRSGCPFYRALPA